MTDLTGGRGWLAPAAAASVHRMDAQKGTLVDINSAGRYRWEQQQLWDLYFYPNGTVRPASQRPSWLFQPARPGESPHEEGDAIDTDDIAWMLAHGPENGWTRPLPKTDPVHFVYNPANDKYSNTITSTQEDDMGLTPDERQLVDHVSDKLTKVLNLLTDPKTGVVKNAASAAAEAGNAGNIASEVRNLINDPKRGIMLKLDTIIEGQKE